MQFASFSFLFLFLPASLAIYHLAPIRWKQPVMLCLSLLFLLGGGIGAALVLLLLTAGTFGAGLLMERLRVRRGWSGLLMGGVAAVFFAALALLRSDWLRALDGSYISGAEFFPPGLAYFALQAVGYCADVRNQRIPAERCWSNLFLYMLFFPRLLMGPVVSYTEARKSGCAASFSIAQVGAGLMRFITGLSKKLLLADALASLFDTITQSSSSYSILILWLGVLAKLGALFLELSGYADMAIGLAMCFGFRLPEGYGKSMLFSSIAAFAERFNRTVVRWFSHYVGGKLRFKNELTRSLAVVFTWCCIGLWYGFRFTHLAWGAFIGLGICIEHAIGIHRRREYRRAHYVLTLLLLCVGLPLLVMPDFTFVGNYLAGMFGMNHLTPTTADWYLLRSHGLVLLAASYVVSGNWQTVMKKVCMKLWYRRIETPLTLTAMLILLLACAAVLMADGTSAFQLLL